MNFRIFITVTIVGMLSACVATGEPADSERQHAKIIELCSATANRYPYLRDRLLYDEYGALFTEDAVFQIEGGPEAVGRPAIVQALRERGPAATTRHVSRVVSMDAIGDATASGISYVTIWRVDAGSMRAGDNLVAAPFVVGEYHDQFKMRDQRCLISKRLVKIVFRGVAEPQ